MDLGALQTVVSITNLVRSLKPGKHQFLTKIIQIKNECTSTRWVDIEFYTVDVDGKWEWRQELGIKIERGVTLKAVNDKHGHRIHAATVRVRAFDEWGLARGDVVEKKILAEPYMADQRSEALVTLHQPLVEPQFTHKILHVKNNLNEEIIIELTRGTLRRDLQLHFDHQPKKICSKWQMFRKTTGWLQLDRDFESNLAMPAIYGGYPACLDNGSVRITCRDSKKVYDFEIAVKPYKANVLQPFWIEV